MLNFPVLFFIFWTRKKEERQKKESFKRGEWMSSSSSSATTAQLFILPLEWVWQGGHHTTPTLVFLMLAVWLVFFSFTSGFYFVFFKSHHVVLYLYSVWYHGLISHRVLLVFPFVFNFFLLLLFSCFLMKSFFFPKKLPIISKRVFIICFVDFSLISFLFLLFLPSLWMMLKYVMNWCAVEEDIHHFPPVVRLYANDYCRLHITGYLRQSNLDGPSETLVHRLSS
jgi:hypothetical protein